MSWKPKSEYGKTKFGTRGLGKPNKKGKRRQLTYFYTTETWENARQSPRFQAWARNQQQPPPKIVKITIKARPLMRPAAAKVKPKIPTLWAKAAQYTK